MYLIKLMELKLEKLIYLEEIDKEIAHFCKNSLHILLINQNELYQQ